MDSEVDTTEPASKVITTLGAAVLTGRTHEGRSGGDPAGPGGGGRGTVTRQAP